jgi:hypothetical protein
MLDGSTTFYIFKGYNEYGLKDGAISRTGQESWDVLQEDNANDEQWTVVLSYQDGHKVSSENFWMLRNFWWPAVRLRYVDHGVVRYNHPLYGNS